jgi:hypothetical protein
MSAENSLIDAALRGWKSNVERVDNLFGKLSAERLERQVIGEQFGEQLLPKITNFVRKLAFRPH